MSAQGTIKRYLLIVEKITSTKFSSFKNISSHLSGHGFEISQRTLQRNIEQIRHEFGIEIKYDRTQNGYYVEKEECFNYDAFMKFLEIVTTGDLLTESLKDGKDAMNYILFERDGNLKGIENLKPLLFAIKNHRKIFFTHENFETGKRKSYQMKPYLLREYQSRWYIVGLTEKIEFRTFGIDRIESIEVLTEIFKPDPKLNPTKLFENIIGLNYSSDEPEEIILSFTPLQGKYIKALPLHRSQEIIKETEKETLIRIIVIPNFELKQKILMMGESVKVIKPSWLRENVIKIIKKSMKRYGK
ncbi:MAG: WYL domain-containing protein [Ferruginibacter sp.]